MHIPDIPLSHPFIIIIDHLQLINLLSSLLYLESHGQHPIGIQEGLCQLAGRNQKQFDQSIFLLLK